MKIMRAQSAALTRVANVEIEIGGSAIPISTVNFHPESNHFKKFWKKSIACVVARWGAERNFKMVEIYHSWALPSLN